MPLPFAPPPKDSSLYQQLESTTLQTLTPDQLDTIRAKTFSQGTEGNEDEYRRLLLLGLASNALSISGPIPGTQLIEKQTFTSAGFRTYLTPGEGEVWLYTGACVNGATGLSGTGTIEVDITNTTNSNRLIVQDFNFTSSADFPVVESGNTQPIYIDHGQRLTINAEGTFTTVIVTAGFIRVR
tara:strand:- start:806 stop:1354 length:549 start_codon:yes stop_codon:yes gene_type:complete